MSLRSHPKIYRRTLQKLRKFRMRLHLLRRNQNPIRNIPRLMRRIRMTHKRLPTHTAKSITPHYKVGRVLLPIRDGDTGRVIEVEVCDLGVYVDVNTEFKGSFEHCFVEVGAVDVPVWVAVIFDAVGDEVYF